MSKLIITRSTTHPYDLVVLKHTLIALGVDESELNQSYDTDLLLEKYDINVVTIKDFFETTPEGQQAIKNASEHAKLYHGKTQDSI